VKRGKDDTLFTIIDGIVEFDRGGKRVNVVPKVETPAAV
jgi:ribosomal protein L27